MIIFRYLFRELLITATAVSAVLLVIIMSGRFIKYLAQAARGVLDPSVLLWVMLYRMPGFLQLILPLGLFLAIMLSYGRLYLESEMAALSASGMSQQRLLLYTLGPAALLALVVGWLALSVAPNSAYSSWELLASQDNLSELETLSAGRFQELGSGARVTYTESLNAERTVLRGVFITERDSGQITTLIAERGRHLIQEDGRRYLVLENGYRYDGMPGQADYRVLQYDRYGVLLPSPEANLGPNRSLDDDPTSTLWRHPGRAQQAELQWRLSLPLIVLVMTLFAVPMAKANPRQGRYLKLLPALFLYMSYLGLLIAMRSQVEKGGIPPQIGLWWVHLLFLCIGALIFFWEPLSLKWAALRAARQEGRP
ncbi:MAG TPA: LPS export ABC transporter permease LptF [Pseudomonas sp.]|uniref:LPS export ABC transporter permease LptF n=1 Tax=Pseudomonas sp. TaxID=306 RepID=UPI002BB44B05|nr:LPS export ABC transporter permease LptF [Pseudomonas sp.]HTO20440.1 LPS export ABC transporter permease LptF [Pseudomonas sp.]